MSVDTILLVAIFGALLVAIVSTRRATRRIKSLEQSYAQPHHHCWHWMLTVRGGLTTYRHCCVCGRIMATYLEVRNSTRRIMEHGGYIEAKPLDVVNEPASN